MCDWVIAFNPDEENINARIGAGKDAHIDAHCEEFVSQLGSNH